MDINKLIFNENRPKSSIINEDNEIIGMNRVGIEGKGFSSNVATASLQDVMPKSVPIFLNLGCGLDVREGFVNIDLFSDNPKVVKMDIRHLEFADNSVDFILASDVLEHFSHRQIESVLLEWNRVLKTNAQILIRCPSLRLQAKAYTTGIWNADIASYMIFGGQTNKGDYHCVAFDKESITAHLQKTGFKVIEFEEEDTPQTNGFINLNMIVKAVKYSDNEKYHSELLETKPQKSEVNSTDIHKTIIDKNETQLNIVWEGSQFVYHSLALVNREHCKNIINAGTVNLTIVPYEPDMFDASVDASYQKIKDNDIRYKADVSSEIEQLPYVWIRHQWPPSAEPPQGAKWIIMQPWEFSLLPDRFVKIFNQCDEIWTPSIYSRQAFINSGIDGDKVQVIPNGINSDIFTPNGAKYPLKTKKRLKLLFVGGTTYRKGFDILLQAYTTSFNSEDDICLVVKDFGNDTFYKGQTSQDLINKAKQNPNLPEIEYITGNLTDIEMPMLYRACDVFVMPYRAEGFSLPTLEAMACGLPTILTKGGATDDFTTDECTWYINSELVDVNSDDENSMPKGTKVLQPYINELSDTMMYIYENPANNYSMGIIAQFVARKYWNWNRATNKLLSRLDFLYGTSLMKNNKLNKKDDDNYILLGDAELAFQKNEIDKAKQLFIYIAEQNNIEYQHLVHIYNRLTMISINENKFLDAYKYNQAAITIDNESTDISKNIDAVYLNSLILNAEKKYDDALENLTTILNNWNEVKFNSKMGIDLENILILVADNLFNVDDLEKSAQVYESALKYNNYSADACFGLANCFYLSDLKENAIEMLNFAIKYKENYKEAIEMLNKIQNEI